MLKRFTLLASSLLAAFSIAAQETTPTASASFATTTGDGGKTLVVTGKGDLTTLITSIKTTVFTNTAVVNVFVKNGEAYVSVTQGSDFSSSETYYKVNVVEPTAIDNTDTNPFLSNTTYVTSSSVVTSWNETKLNETPLYYCTINGSGDGFKWINTPTLVNIAIHSYNEDLVYAVEATSDNFDLKLYVEGGDHKLYRQIKDNELNAYLNKYTEFTAAKTIYASTDGTNFTKIEAGSTAVYNSNATYYIAESSTFSAYENTSTFSTNEWIEDKISEEKLFKDLLNDKILEGAENDANNGVTTNFETVRFENEDRSTSLIINDDIVHAILFPTKDSYKKKNNSI